MAGLPAVTVPIERRPLVRAGNHPYVVYRSGPDSHGQWWIECQCRKCGDHWRKPCMDPRRTNHHVMRYATYHGHGLRPVQR